MPDEAYDGERQRSMRPRRFWPRPKSSADQEADGRDDEAKAEWQRIVPELDAMGVLSRVDRPALAAYCTLRGPAGSSPKSR